MRDIHRIIDVTVAITSTRPLCAVVEIEAVNSTMKFELTEEIALRLCTDLERFLTQEPLPERTAAPVSR